MRARLITSFLIFALLVLAVLWVFQTFFTDDIYGALMNRNIDKCSGYAAQLMKSGADDDAISSGVLELSRKYGTCISVYRLKNAGIGKSGELISDGHVNTFCIIHNLRTVEWINRLYKETCEAGGEHKESVSLAEMFGMDETDESGKNVIVSKVVMTPSDEYLILLNSELAPLSATTVTMRVEIALISVILVIAAIVLALVISSRISRPLADMSNEASKLALGDYAVNFKGGRCTETANLSSALNKAAYELSKLDRMQKDLIANISHDLRTPLTMISGYTEAMRDLPGETTAENMQIVLDETKRLTELVNDMVDISRYQGGNQVLHNAVFNFTNVVKITFERYQKLREKDGYTICFEFESDAYVNADEGRILQVIYNLVNNAVNYTGEDKSVVIRQTTADGWVTLEVTDTGCGIPEEQLPLVWERYYKVHDFHKRADMGTGLGLSIVKSILLMHGALFGVRSTVGEGSTFWFSLPEISSPNHETDGR